MSLRSCRPFACAVDHLHHLTFHSHSFFYFFLFLEMVFSQQLRLPHALPLGKAIGNPDPAEVLDAFLHLLLRSHLLLVGFPLGRLSVADAEGSHAQHVRLATHLCLLHHVGRSFGQRAVQRLDVGPPAHGPIDDRSLGGIGLRLGLGTGSGELVEGSAALALALAFVALAAAVAVRGHPP